ncbi:MAG TPA: PilZ domain-containing protein [Vicinamibacterales bacterium]|nr:PilZ domain-containing protein [Vicinamibacterales bacterium]
MSRSSERRRAIRHRLARDHEIVSARIRPGHPATVVDVSAGGALIETTRRLLPGSAVEIQVERRDERVAVRGRVARCAVSRLHPACVWYRGAIVFDQALHWFHDAGAAGYPVLPGESREGTTFRVPATHGPI